MNIITMQNGGGMPPFVYFQPVVTNRQQPSVVSSDTSSQKDTTDKGALGDKDLMSLLSKIDGLPVDMDLLFRKISNFYVMQDAGVNTKSLALTMLEAYHDLKVAKFNKEQFTEAQKQIIKKDGLEETAVDNMGRVFFVDKDNKLQAISVDQYLQNKDKIGVMPLTNHQLLQYRASNPTQTMDNTLLTVVSNGIGLSYINKLIKEASTALGETLQSSTGYVKREQQQIIEGIEYLKEAVRKVGASDQNMSVDGLYKAKYLTKDQAEQAEFAIKYLYQALPDNAKQLLKLKTGSDKGVTEFIVASVTRGMKSTIQFEDWKVKDPDLTGTKGHSSSGSNGSDFGNDLFQNIIHGTGGTYTTYNILDENGNYLTVKGTGYPNLSENASKPVDAEGSLQDLLSEHRFNSVLKGGNFAITFGDQVLSAEDMPDIAYVSDGNAVRTILPVKYDEETHKMVPDLQFLEDNKDLIELINKKQNIKDPEVVKKMQEKGILDPYTGLPDMNRFQSYLLVNGLATSRNVSDNSQFVHEITSSSDKYDQWIDKFERSVYRKKTEGQEGSAYKFGFDRYNSLNPFDWGPGWSDKLYQGTIFIPLTENQLQAAIGAGTPIKNNQADDLESIYQQGEMQNVLSPTGSNLLGL